jgi:hypothetical protein
MILVFGNRRQSGARVSAITRLAADDRKMEALPAIIDGRAGGFPGWVNECFAGGRQSPGIERAKITYEIAPDLGHWGVEIGGAICLEGGVPIGTPPGCPLLVLYQPLVREFA